jgi:pimeloyl-ACP methyl ester carboxylesterase
MTYFRTLLATTALSLLAGVTAAHAAPANAVKDIVLVHGAFADGSGWKPIADILRKDGYKVHIAQPPETSFEEDVTSVTRILDQLEGLAVLVGHSYGGAIITEAGNNAHVKNLVYVAALQPDTGESAGQLLASKPAAGTSIVPSKDGFLTILPDHFRADFAADLPANLTDFMAAAQIPLSVKAASTPIKAAAWRSKPSYAIVATGDRAINPDLERTMYARSKSTTTELTASHAVYISQPHAVAKVIEQAAVATAK